MVQYGRRLLIGSILTVFCSCSFKSPPEELAQTAELSCDTFISERLFFGFHIPGSAVTVSESQWRQFVEQIVTPRFPAGLTILEAEGQWKGGDDRIEREASRVVEVVHPDNEEAFLKVSEIVREYKLRFGQEAVLVVRNSVGACF